MTTPSNANVNPNSALASEGNKPDVLGSDARESRRVANSLRVNAPGHDAFGLPIPPDQMTDEQFQATRPSDAAVAAILRPRNPDREQNRGVPDRPAEGG